MTTDYFERFAWAVPSSYADALSACQFLEGDMLYCSRAAYEKPWGEATKELPHWVQVRHPSRSAGMAHGTDAAIAFEANWVSTVELVLCQGDDHENARRVSTTQGNLYSALWHGDVSHLNEDAPRTTAPRHVKYLRRHLKALVKHHQAHTPTFYMVRDLASTFYMRKHSETRRALEGYPLEVEALAPEQLNIDADQVAPTLDVVAYRVRGEVGAITESLKAALYKPTKESTKDMFRLNAHGYLRE